MNSNKTEVDAADVLVPSLQALEAAAIMQLVEVLQDSKTKPSEEAVLILARMMAHRAQRELQAKLAVADGIPPNIDNLSGIHVDQVSSS